MNKIISKHIVYIIIAAFFVSCTGTRKLAEGEYLARNGTVKFIEHEKVKETAEIRMGISKQVEVKHNRKILWMRPRLSIHNTIKEPKKDKGFKYWLKYKLGRKPVIYSETLTNRIKASIEDYLFNEGYFNNYVQLDVQTKKNQKKPNYNIYTEPPYLINDIAYMQTGASIDSSINTIVESYAEDIRTTRYSLNNLIEYRKELAYKLMNSGYYYFRPDFLEFIADTNIEGLKVNLALKIKDNTPENVFRRYHINQVYIDDYFSLDTTYTADTIFTNDIHYISPSRHINPRVITNAVHLQPNSLYNRDMHLKTLNHIRSLEVYKFVNIIYTPDSILQDKLNAKLILVPLSDMSFSGELNANFKSNNFTGPGVLLSLTKRNTFKGAELFNLSFGGRFETQVGQNFSNNTSYEVRSDVGIQMPRLYPFKSRRIRRQHIPTTRINTGLGLQERIEWYQMVNWNTSLGYTWRSSDKVSQRVSPLDINLSSLLQTTEQFDKYLLANPSVRRSFEEQFILGMSYDFFYSSSTDRLNTPFFFSLTLDFSGNFINAFAQLNPNNAPPSPERPYRIFGTPYSQYSRAIIDIRKKVELWPKNSFASRLIVAGGIPYGNSSVMPYIKQFYVGGANSLRGFQARSVGPGSYNAVREENVYVDQAADLKLEMNLEYRFPLWGVLKSAVFADIGNIWLVNEDETREGGKFDPGKFLNELAVSTGVGFRFDINPIIIRFDWAWPIRYPYPVGNSHWVINDIQFSNYSWRKNNLILNISLGYPF